MIYEVHGWVEIDSGNQTPDEMRRKVKEAVADALLHLPGSQDAGLSVLVH